MTAEREPRTRPAASLALLTEFREAYDSEKGKTRKAALLDAWAVVERRLPAIEEQAAAEARRGLLAKVEGLEPGDPAMRSNDREWYRDGWYAHEAAVLRLIEEASRV